MGIDIDLFGFSGRLNRKSYFFHHLLLLTMYIGSASIIIYLLPDSDDYSLYSDSQLFALYALIIVIAISEASASVRRLHDLGRSGIYYWLLFVPFYNVYLLGELFFKKGDEEPNEFSEESELSA